MDRMRWRRVSPYLVGVGASLGLLGFYLALMTLTGDWYYALIQFEEYRFWIIALSLGLGIQTTLFMLLKRGPVGKEGKTARSALAASGGVSTASMVACCLHHVTDIFPVIGLPLLAAALQKYQVYFFLAGVLSNLYGIRMMLLMMARHGIIQWEPTLKALWAGTRIHLLRGGQKNG